MVKKIIVTACALGVLLTAGVALAQTDPSTSSGQAQGSTTPPIFKPLPVSFPIAALGGCTDKEACKAYCDIAANHDACFVYAEAHGLMTRAQIVLAQKLLTAVGPGGCQGEECKNYCQNSEHAQVCVTFARQNGFISNSEAQKRLEMMRVSSTTRPLPPIPVTGTGTVTSSTPLRPRPDIRPASTIKPPPHREASSTGQSGSIFFSILHALGL